MRISLELSAGSRSREPEPRVQIGPQSQAKPGGPQVGTRSEVAILGAAIKQDKPFKSGRTWQVRLVKSITTYYHSLKIYLLSNYYCVPGTALGLKNRKINRIFLPNI